MNKIKKFFKNIIVSFLIFYIIIANTSSSYARNFDDAARAFLAEQTENFINTYTGDSVYSLTVLPANFVGTTFHSCCTSGIAYVYNENARLIASVLTEQTLDGVVEEEPDDGAETGDE